MTKTVYLTGQNNFGNRGCEALVRSTVDLLREHVGKVRILVPSLDRGRDAAQWPEAADKGVVFVDTPAVPAPYVHWNRLVRRVPLLARMPWPALRPDPGLRRTLAGADAVLSIGGDNYSLDYDLASLFFFAGIADHARSLGKPVVLWGASVGPFSARPSVERQMISHLKRLSLVTVRESASLAYLARHGVTANVAEVTDSAFVMTPEAIDVTGFWPRAGGGVLGLNVSPLIEKVRRASGAGTTIREEVAAFIRRVLSETECAVLLIPHVAPLNGATTNNDEIYLRGVLEAAGGESERLRAVPGGLNAAQLKHVVSQCRWLLAARTHATIAGFSSAVPTVSIAYSVKARGINRDLFGHERYVLDTTTLDAASLWGSFSLMRAEERAIRQHYATRLGGYRGRAATGARWLGEALAAVAA